MLGTFGTRRSSLWRWDIFSNSTLRQCGGETRIVPVSNVGLKSKEVAMARSYLPSLFGRDDDPFDSLFREVQITFEDFSRRSPLSGFGSDMLAPRIDIAESKDAIDLTAELTGGDEKDVDV